MSSGVENTSDKQPTTSPRWYRRVLNELVRIRTILFTVNAILVAVPLLGLTFARIYERELLRSEEDGMTHVALAFSSLSARVLSDPTSESVLQQTLEESVHKTAESLHAQIRILDARGRALIDSGPEEVAIVTQGRQLLSSYPWTRRRVVVRLGDDAPSSGDFSAVSEVTQALTLGKGRAYRRETRIRGVRLFVAEAVRDSGDRIIGVVYVSRSTYPVLVGLYRVRNGLVKIAIGSLVVALALAIVLGVYISRSLGKLTTAAQRIAQGERRVELNHRAIGEIGELSNAFDVMSKQLDKRLTYISEFAANVSHEFKTPIASIRGAAELLLDGASDDAKAREKFLQNIIQDTERMNALVSRLLELSRLEASLAHKTTEPIDLVQLVQTVVEQYNDQAGIKKRVQFESNLASVSCRGHAEHLQSVVQNLIDNALRFSPVDTVVLVKVNKNPNDPKNIMVSVVDHGVGISKENLAKIWERFFTTDRVRGGTGLGLAIVKAIIEAHGGGYGVESEMSKGSVFWFSLPTIEST